MAEEPRQTPVASPGDAGGGAQPALDLAGQSLAHALRMSFRILTFIIAVLVLVFLLSGMFSVQENEVAVVLHFGKTATKYVKEQGFRYALPYPLDKVVRISTVPRTVNVDTFWPTVNDVQKMKALQKDVELDVVEGAEGAYMLTGDLNILQSCWTVRYQIQRDLEKKLDKQAVINYYTKIGLNEDEKYDDAKRYDKADRLIKFILQSAVVEEIGKMSVSDAYPRGHTFLAANVLDNMERVLGAAGLECGLEIKSVELKRFTPPVSVKAAFEAYTQAEQTKQTVITNAESAAVNILIGAVGNVIADDIDTDLSELWEARTRGDEAEVKRLDKVIAEYFHDSRLGGAAKDTIKEAETYKETVVSRTKGVADRVRQIAARTPRERAVFLDRLRSEALGSIMETAYEKYMYRPLEGETEGTLEIWISRLPELMRAARKVQETK